MTASFPPRVLVDELDRSGIEYAFIPHRHTDSAKAEARALNALPAQVAKTVVLVSGDGFVRAVVPASARLDLRKICSVVPGSVRLATEEELAGAYPDFELGAIPPFVLGDGDRVIVDIRLCGNEEVFLDAGTHEQSLRLDTADLLELARAELADICEG